MTTRQRQNIHALAFRKWRRNFTPTDYKWQDLRLKDGTIIAVTELKPGGICLQGLVPPAPGSRLELADGRTVFIGVGGIIGAIQSADEKPGYIKQQTPGQKMAATNITPLNDTLERVKSLARRLKRGL